MTPLPPLGFKSFAPAYVLEGNYYSIATVTVPSGGVSTVTFAGVPSGYKHLELRGTFAMNANDSDFSIRFNSDSGSNYTKHQLWGDGSTAYASGAISQTSIPGGVTQVSGGVSASITNILDYANINKNKTVRTLNGSDSNGSGSIWLRSGAWLNTAPITSIVLIPTNGASLFNQYSHFALYGVK